MQRGRMIQERRVLTLLVSMLQDDERDGADCRTKVNPEDLQLYLIKHTLDTAARVSVAFD